MSLPRSVEVDRQRHPVEAAAGRADVRAVTLGHREARSVDSRRGRERAGDGVVRRREDLREQLVGEHRDWGAAPRADGCGNLGHSRAVASAVRSSVVGHDYEDSEDGELAGRGRGRVAVYNRCVSLLSLVLLVAAAVVVVGAEWTRLARQIGIEPGARHSRGRARRKSKLRVIRGGGTVPAAGDAADASDADDFVASVRRDLDRLPTFDRDADRDR